MKTNLTLAITLALVAASNALAGSATWLRNPLDGDWNNPANWRGEGPPNGPEDVATFNFSLLGDVFLSAPTTLDTLVVSVHADSVNYTITAPTGTQLSFAGTGITSFSYLLNFVTDASSGSGGGFIFSNSASSGGANFTNRGGTARGESGGFVEFVDSAQAPVGIITRITNEGGTVAGAGGGFTELRDTTNLGLMEFYNLAGVKGAGGGSTSFYDSTTGSGDRVAYGGTEPGAGPGSIHFFGNSTGGSTLTANGGTDGADGGIIDIRDNCQGFGRIVLNGNGVLDLSHHNPAIPVTVSSIEGQGSILLGRSNLTIGLPPYLGWHYFAGVISDGGKGGSITFTTGDQFGAVVISSASTYTGGTTIDGFNVYVLSANGSGTGRGPVSVPRGLVGGTGTIGGALTIGDGTGDPGYLSPGSDFGGPGILTVQKKVTFKSDAIYTFQVNSDTGGLQADQLNAKGISIESGAKFNTSDLGAHVLRPGTRFFAIKNTSPSPIAGTFANLPDGSTITVGNNTFQANYEGGDGNDLTLTVL